VAGSLLGNNAFNNVVFPSICSITNGTYTIDPATGLITSSATLGAPNSVPSGLNSCLFVSNPNVQEVGYLSDPTGQKLYVVETGQLQTDVLSLVYTKAATQNTP